MPLHLSQNILDHKGRLCQIYVLTLLHRNHVSVCNGNTTAIPVHVLALNWKFIATLIIIKIKHVIICVTKHRLLRELRQGSGCRVLTLCDAQLVVPASTSDCKLCGYVLEYYSALFVCLSQLIFVTLPYIYC